MWYENVYIGDLKDQCDVVDKDYKISKFYPKMPELKDVIVHGLHLYSEYYDTDFVDSTNMYLIYFDLIFNMPYFPENVPQEWIDADVTTVIGNISVEYPEYVEVNYISLNPDIPCSIDITKDESDEYNVKYIISVSGGVEAKIICDGSYDGPFIQKPFIAFSLDKKPGFFKMRENFLKELARRKELAKNNPETSKEIEEHFKESE